MSAAAAAASSSASAMKLFQEFHSRKLRIRSFKSQSPNSADPPASSTHDSFEYTGDSNFDTNVVMVLSVLLCALICSLGLNSIIRCALRFSRFRSNDESANSRAPARVANTGVKRKALRTFPIVNYSAEQKLPGLDTECVICLADFTNGERVRLLPKCNHGFHIRCIDKWLRSHSSCPKCRQCLVGTCQKIVGRTQVSPVTPPAPVLPSEIIVRIAPLEPEALIRDCRQSC